LGHAINKWHFAFIASQFVALTAGLVEMDQCSNLTKHIKGNRIVHRRSPSRTYVST